MRSLTLEWLAFLSGHSVGDHEQVFGLGTAVSATKNKQDQSPFNSKVPIIQNEAAPCFEF